MEINEHFEFSAVPDEPMLTVTVRHLLSGRTMALRTIAGVVFILGVLWWSWGSPTAAGIHLLLAVAVGVVVPIVLTRASVRVLRSTVGRETCYRFDAEGIRITEPLSEVLYRWPLVSAVTELPGALAIRVGPRFVPVPVTFVAPETLTALVAFIRSRAAATA